MEKTTDKLTHPPIVEAVIDIECDMPLTFDLSSVEKQACELFKDKYPHLQKQLTVEHQLKQELDQPLEFSVRQGIQALQFRSEDGCQLIQLRSSGFAFNRLAPYSSLDDYLPEIERTWGLFAELTLPAKIQKVVLRYINRLSLPSQKGSLELSDYLKICPRLPEEKRLRFTGFMNHHSAVEQETGNFVNIILAMQPVETDTLPVIFDIEAFRTAASSSTDWKWILESIISLRDLKNSVFRDTLTQKCLNLFH